MNEEYAKKDMRRDYKSDKYGIRRECAELKKQLIILNDKLDSAFHFFGVALSIAGVLITALQIYIALK